VAESPLNGRKPINCQKAHKWQKLSQLAETLLLAASLPYVRKSPSRPTTHHLAENLPSGRTSTIRQNTCQMAEQHTYYELHSIMLYTMIGSFCHAVSFVYSIAKALILVLLQSRFLPSSFFMCLSHRDSITGSFIWSATCSCCCLYPLCTLRPVHCFGLHFDCFVLLPVAWVLTSLARDTFWVRFILLPLSCHYDCYILDTIFVKQHCSRSSFHNFFRSVSCTQYLSWDRADNVLRVNLTLTLCY